MLRVIALQDAMPLVWLAFQIGKCSYTTANAMMMLYNSKCNDVVTFLNSEFLSWKECDEMYIMTGSTLALLAVLRNHDVQNNRQNHRLCIQSRLWTT